MRDRFYDLAARLFRIAFFVGVCVVAVLSLVPMGPVLPVQHGDKLVHFLTYAALATCGVLGFRTSRAILPIVAGLVLLGSAIEVVQTFTPYRFGSVIDAVANTLGALVGGLAAHFGIRRFELYRRPQSDTGLH